MTPLLLYLKLQPRQLPLGPSNMLQSFSPVSTGTVFLLWHSLPPFFSWNGPSPIQFASLRSYVTSSETVLTSKPKIGSLSAPWFFLRASYYFPLKTFHNLKLYFYVCSLVYPHYISKDCFLFDHFITMSITLKACLKKYWIKEQMKKSKLKDI